MPTWDAVGRRLEQELGTLSVREFVVVGEPRPPAGPPRGLLRRRHQPPWRYVQALRVEEAFFYAECVGATHFDGFWEMTPAQDKHLRSIGWYIPGEDNPWEAQPSVPNYFRYHETSEAADLARLCAASLEVLGLGPDSVQWKRDQ